VTEPGAGSASRRPRIASLWQKHRARWTLPLVIIVIIGAVAVIDHLGSHRISQVDQTATSQLVAATGGGATVELDQPWSGFNPDTPAGAASSTPTLLSSVLPSAYVINSKLQPEVNSDLLLSVEATSISPLTIQYVINPKATWSDGVPVSADDFVYAWESQRGDGLDVNGQPDQVASTLGYDDISSVTPSHGGKTVTVTFSTPYTDWRDLFDHMVPAHIARRVGWNDGFETFDPALDLSAGPYLLHSVSADRAVLLKNPKWWGTPAILDRVTVNVAEQERSWTGALAAGNHTVVQPANFDMGGLQAVSSLPNTESVLKPSLNFLDLEFNVTTAPMDRTALRQAVALAIDRTSLLAHTFGTIDPDLVVDQDHLATPALPSYNASSAAAAYDTADPTASDHLLKGLGYHRDASGDYVGADGKPLTLRMAVETGGPWISGVAALLAAQLRAAGITVVTTPVAGVAGLEATLATDSYDMALVTRVSSPYGTATAGWYSVTVGGTGSLDQQDWSQFDDPEVDQLFVQAAEDLDPVAGAAIYGEIDDQLWDQMVALPLFGEPGLLANGVQISGMEYNPSEDGVLWNVPLWNILVPSPSGKPGSTTG
jgi:peptide/nickel transport system substrate-binding protein